jgi:hypothetical protein
MKEASIGVFGFFLLQPSGRLGSGNQFHDLLSVEYCPQSPECGPHFFLAGSVSQLVVKRRDPSAIRILNQKGFNAFLNIS